MIIKEIRNWPYGIVNKVEPESIPVGSLSAANNFLTKGDKIEQRRGQLTRGTVQTGVSSVAGLGVANKLDSTGTQVMFRKRTGTRKFEYYDESAADWAETGSNAAPAASNSDEFAFDTYQSPAGSQAFWSSRQSSIYKIMVANPASITDLLSTVYRGFIRIKQNRMFLWNRNAASGSAQQDEQNIYMSFIDSQSYTSVSSEALSDVSAGTLAFKAAGSKRTCFGVVITITTSGQIFTDNRDGTLTGDAGGTGTIDYTTGAYTTDDTGAGTADYQWEDSTDDALADFGYTTPTRVAGEGNVFLQGDGGPLYGIETYGDVEYCMHSHKTYALTLSADDTNATNLLFRDREGIPHWRAIKGTSIGIFYVNAVDVSDPKIKLLTTQVGSTAVEGQVISQNLDLSGYVFDKAFVQEWGDFIITGCRTSDSDSNNRFILYNKVWKSWDICDYWGTVAVVYNGGLEVGDSITGNVYSAFSGFDDDGAAIDAFAELNEWDLDYPGYYKVCKELHLEGEIGPDQVYDVYASIDHGAYVLMGQIKGSDSYVDRSQRVDIGSLTMGRGEIGGGSDGAVAYHYYRVLKLKTGKFERVKIKLQRSNYIDSDDASNNYEGIGYFSLSLLRFKDVRLRSRRVPTQYR